jgi:amino acid adenylation domain-containing protein
MNPLFTESNFIPTAVDFDPFAAGELLLTAPATEAQREIWASVQMGKEANCAYNESQSLRLRGELDVEAFRSALQALIQRHEALRTTLSPDGNHLCIADGLNLELPYLDLCDLTLLERDRKVASLQRRAVEQPFDLEHGPLFRAEILKLQSQEHLILVTAHHIICDGWSWAVLMPDLGKLYSALKQGLLPELKPADSFSHYALTLEVEANSPEVTSSEDYWLKQFSDLVPVVDLPTDRPRPALRTFESDREDWQLSPQVVSGLKQLGTQLGCSFMSTLLAGFEVWLYRLTGQTDVVVGVLAAGQAATGLYNLVGHCVNLLPMRSQMDHEQAFSSYLQGRRSTILDAYDHQQFTFGSLVQKLTIPRDSSRIPLVPVLLNIDQGMNGEQLPFDGLAVEFFSNPRSYENFELFVNATELKGTLTLECQYNRNLFDADTIRRRMAELETLLAGIVAYPDRPICHLPLLPETERQLLASWHQTQAAYPQDQCIHQLFEAQVERTPDAIAVVLDDRALTYQELDHRANQLAHYLQKQGVESESLVGISLERTPEMLIALLAVLKAGGAYVPLDPTYPQERLALMIQDAQVPLLITHSDLVAQLPTSQAQMICLDREEAISSSDPQGVAQQSTDPLNCPIASDSLAYVIYTSGSTGTPKGVQVPHRGVVNFLTSMQQKPGIVQTDILLSVTTLSFDIAVLELLLPLTIGATTLLVSRQVAMNGEALLKTLEHSGATIMQATPATWRLLLAVGWKGSPHLKILCGGEALPSALAGELVNRAKEVWNLYGPTETTIWSTCYLVKDDAKPLIGRPIANTQLYLLDDHQQQVPIGVLGELYIGGDGVVRGYLDRPDLTAERFLPNPFSNDPQSRYYRTGDLARYLPDGNLEYLQRIDQQVKVRGFRIELGEIEATILQHSSIKEAVVSVRADASGEKTLVGYLVPASTQQTDLIPNLRQFLKAKLPEHMLPIAFMTLETLPLTPNGKIDRKALPQIDSTARSLLEHYVAPRSQVEQQMAEIWKQILKLDRIGIHDNFFELGGYSLLAIQIVSRLRPLLQVEIPLPSLFELPTIAALSERVEALRWAQQGMQTGADDEYEEGEL